MRHRVRVLLAAALIFSAQAAVPAATAEPARPAAGNPIPGQYLVTLKTGYNPQEVLNRLGATPLFVYATAVIGFAAKLTALQVNLLRKTPGFESIEQDAEIDAVSITDSQRARAVGSWGLDRIDQRDLPLNGAYTASHDGSNVTAYIVDTGIDFGHGEFGGRARAGYDAIGDGRNGADCNGHGTHVAGTVGGSTYGVAKKVKLVSVRVLGCDGRGAWSGIVAGFDWVARNAVKPAVINASLGGTPGVNAVDSASDGASNNGVFTAVAAGNDTADACDYSPARASKPITIGATTKTDGYAGYSNRGTCVQLLAPGTDITSAWPGGGTNTISGTSMASPHVAGVAALYKQAYGDRSQAEVNNWLWQNASTGKIGSVPANTPNYLLFSAGL
ncbi:S8 family peptidase [Amycolatopsis anabasis]|uniref:S8 family peptidase n=1 Tax=Amycolatopsis anabasis TaxID=1840409 RepID=UPI00131EC31C|nr:S8 family peptidase [Amycolatopsis anabasis]